MDVAIQFTDAMLSARGLPVLAYIDNHDRTLGVAPVIAVQRGEAGYSTVDTYLTAEELNRALQVTPAQAEAMFIGAMMGWHVRGSYPQTWERLAQRRQEVLSQPLVVYDQDEPESLPRAA